MLTPTLKLKTRGCPLRKAAIKTEYGIICLIVYTVLFFTDLFPLIKRKEWSYLHFYIPVYIVTLILNLIIGAGLPYTGITKILEGILSFAIK